MIFDLIDNATQYFPGSTAWERVFKFYWEYIEKGFLLGITEIEGRNLYASVSEYETKSADSALFETHQEYIDVQIILSGAEIIRYCPRPDVLEDRATEYDTEKDVEFFRQTSDRAVDLVMKPGSFAVFFPEDAHLPQLSYGKEACQVKKVVFKLSISSLI